MFFNIRSVIDLTGHHPNWQPVFLTAEKKLNVNLYKELWHFKFTVRSSELSTDTFSHKPHLKLNSSFCRKWWGASNGFRRPAYCKSLWIGKKYLRKYCGHSRYCNILANWMQQRLTILPSISLSSCIEWSAIFLLPRSSNTTI